MKLPRRMDAYDAEGRPDGWVVAVDELREALGEALKSNGMAAYIKALIKHLED